MHAGAADSGRLLPSWVSTRAFALSALTLTSWLYRVALDGAVERRAYEIKKEVYGYAAIN